MFLVVGAPAITYSGPPKRPLQITDSERRSFDVAINNNTRIVLSLDVFHHSNETAVRVRLCCNCVCS